MEKKISSFFLNFRSWKLTELCSILFSVPPPSHACDQPSCCASRQLIKLRVPQALWNWVPTMLQVFKIWLSAWSRHAQRSSFHSILQQRRCSDIHNRLRFWGQRKWEVKLWHECNSMFKSSFIIYYDFYYNIIKNQHNRLEFMLNIETSIFSCDSSSIPRFVTDWLTDSRDVRNIWAECHNSAIFQHRDFIKTSSLLLDCT